MQQPFARLRVWGAAALGMDHGKMPARDRLARQRVGRKQVAAGAAGGEDGEAMVE